MYFHINISNLGEISQRSSIYSESGLSNYLGFIDKKITLVALCAFAGIAALFWMFKSSFFSTEGIKTIPKSPTPAENQDQILTESDNQTFPKSPTPPVKHDWTFTDIGNQKFIKTYSNGMIEKGHFENEELHGKGKRRYRDKTVQPRLERDSEIKSLKGRFENGRFITGEVRFFDGRLFTVNPHCFKPSWDDMYDHGLWGKINYMKVKESQKIEEMGHFKDMKLHGMGLIRYLHGHRESGNFRDGNFESKDAKSIFVKTLSDGTYMIKMDASDTVEDLKRKIDKQVGIPIDEQRLIFGGRTLNDQESVLSNCFQDGTTLYLTRRQAGD